MKVNRVFLVAAATALSAVVIPSCTYQPHYSDPYYSSGYGHGYGYGGRSFTTTHFIRTSNPRWAYDPYTRCYYDYTRRSYYDPYLYGYYPVGYRPVYVHGTPHPHGWRSSNRYIAPPSRINDYRLDNYQNRSERYRSLNTNWSKNIKSASPSRSYESASSRYDRSRESRSGSFFGLGGQTSPDRTSQRSRNTYVNESQDRRRSEPRMIQPRQEPQRSIEPSQPRQREERSSVRERDSNSNRERGGLRADFERPEAMIQPTTRDRSSSVTREDRRVQSSPGRSSGFVEERMTRRR